MGSTPAPGVPTRRIRRVTSSPEKPLKGESILRATRVAGEGASHGARGGRGPLELHRYGLARRTGNRKWQMANGKGAGAQGTARPTGVRCSG
jgi:hypothetical protein